MVEITVNAVDKLRLFCIFGVVLLTGCSFDVPHAGNSLTINIDDRGAHAERLNLGFDGPPRILSGAIPSQTSDFNCYLANVTGAGIIGGNQFSQCSNLKSTDNMHGAGFGIVSNVVTPGTAIQMDLPAGPARNIEIYGIYPTPTACGGTPNSNGGTDSSGYFLGSVVQDLLQSTTVTVGINYNQASAQLTCSSPPQIVSIVPTGGPLGGGLLVGINGNSFKSGVTVALTDISGNAVPCTGLTAIGGNNNNLQCTVGTASAAGAGSLIVTNPDGQTTSVPFTFNGGVFLFWNDGGAAPPYFTQPGAFSYGSVTSGSTAPTTFYVFNLGGTSTTAGTTTTSITGSGSSAFSVNADLTSAGYCGSSTITAGGLSPSTTVACMIEVDFTPPSPGTYNATVTLNLGSSTIVRTVTGTGI